MRHIALFLFSSLVLGGCGVEVASTAAVSGVSKAEEARQAQQTMDNTRQRINAATEALQQRAAEGEKAADR